MMTCSTALRLLFLFLVLAASDLEAVIIIIVLYIYALNINHASSVGLKFSLLFIRSFAKGDLYYD